MPAPAPAPKASTPPAPAPAVADKGWWEWAKEKAGGWLKTVWK
jgi:hypothetical protein